MQASETAHPIIERTLFSDEKIFTVGLQTPTNTHNDRVYARVRKKLDMTHGRLQLIDGAIFQWSRRIAAAVVAACGRHVENSFDWKRLQQTIS